MVTSRDLAWAFLCVRLGKLSMHTLYVCIILYHYITSLWGSGLNRLVDLRFVEGFWLQCVVKSDGLSDERSPSALRRTRMCFGEPRTRDHGAVSICLFSWVVHVQEQNSFGVMTCKMTCKMACQMASKMTCKMACRFWDLDRAQLQQGWILMDFVHCSVGIAICGRISRIWIGGVEDMGHPVCFLMASLFTQHHDFAW